MNAGGIWKGYFLVAEFEGLENLDASEIYPRRLNGKEVLITHGNGEFAFPAPSGTAKLSGRDYEFQEPTLRREQTVRRGRVSVEIIMAKRKSLNRQNQKMTPKPAKMFGPFKVTSSIVITLNSSSTLCAHGRHIPFSIELH